MPWVIPGERILIITKCFRDYPDKQTGIGTDKIRSTLYLDGSDLDENSILYSCQSKLGKWGELAKTATSSRDLYKAITNVYDATEYTLG